MNGGLCGDRFCFKCPSAPGASRLEYLICSIKRTAAEHPDCAVLRPVHSSQGSLAGTWKQSGHNTAQCLKIPFYYCDK